MITTKIVHDHRGRAKKGADGPVEIRVTVNRSPYYIDTGVRCPARCFRDEGVIDTPDADVLNDRVSAVRRYVETACNELLTAGSRVDGIAIRRRVRDMMNNGMTTDAGFLEWFEDIIYKLPFAKATLKNYETTLRRVREYGRMKSWRDITTENVKDWCEWLAARGVGQASIWGRFKDLSALLERAFVLGYIESNPAKRLRGIIGYRRKDVVQYLTKDEIHRLMSLPRTGKRIDKARDLFVFQMFTGLSYRDAVNFDINNYRLVDGRWVGVGQRVKTGVAYISELLPPAVEVLERYDYRPPYINIASYNIFLRKLAAQAGIATYMHSHVARHTFATLMLNSGARIENVSRMLGHTNVKQTERYARVLAKSVHDDFRRAYANFIADDK